MKVSTLGPIVLALIALPQSLTAQFNKPITEREFPFGGLHGEVFKITYPNMNWVSTTGIPNPDGTITFITCLLYTSDAADERSSVDLGGRRIIKKKKIAGLEVCCTLNSHEHHIDMTAQR